MKNSEDEKWIKMNGDGYWVSSKGRVFSEPRQVRFEVGGKEFFRQKRARYLKLNLCPTGYLRVKMPCGVHLVHQLIGIYFLGCTDWSENTINHKDLNKHNNCIENLEVISVSENVKHAWRNGAHDNIKSSVRRNSDGKVFESIHEAARSLDMAVGNLCSHLKGRQKTFAGSTWEYCG